jgi:hypothetical protein
VRQLTRHSFVVGMGPQTYDALKASRITLLHVLVGWTLARILLANGRSQLINQREDQIHQLGKALGRSKLFFKNEDWATQLIPHMWFKPGSSWRDK